MPFLAPEVLIMGWSLFVAFVAPDHSYFGSILSESWNFALSKYHALANCCEVFCGQHKARPQAIISGPRTTGLNVVMMVWDSVEAAGTNARGFGGLRAVRLLSFSACCSQALEDANLPASGAEGPLKIECCAER